MGWIFDDENESASEHEGYIAFLAPDGRTAAATNSQGILLRRADADERVRAAWSRDETPRNDDMYEQVPWADVIALRVECACGWQGLQWDRTDVADTDPDPTGGLDPESLQLPDGSILDDIAHNAWLSHVAPYRGIADVEAAAAAVAAARERLDQAVAAARSTTPPASWADIGRATGMTRQGAHDRWATLDLSTHNGR